MKTTETIFYQLCPKCSGEGTLNNSGTSSSVNRICDVCKGAKILANSLKTTEEKEGEVCRGLQMGYEEVIDDIEMWYKNNRNDILRCPEKRIERLIRTLNKKFVKK